MLVIKVLGPLTVERDSMKVPLNAPMLRRVLATLAANANRLVPIDSLIAALWSDAAPAGARKTVQIYVHRLRAALGGQLSIGQEADGYRLTATPVELDSMQFDDLTTKGRDHLRQGKQREAADLLGKALTLWRGPAYEDMGELPSVLDHARRLDEARLRVFTEWIEARLDLGHQEDLIPELVGEVEKHPYREDLCGLLMLALYRSGRQSEALDVFRKTRQTLVDDLGIEPGPSLRKLHESVLRSAPELELVAPDDKPMVIPRELPAGTAGFTGRADQLASLDLILKNPSQNSVSIALITGAGGVGKTALALHWAHQAAKHFPDGQLFVDLRGYAAGTRMRPTEVLTAFLRSLGVPPRRIPIDVNEAAALYRSQVAGRRMLVVLDNARSPNDVRMLLPGTTGCLVLVTSRDRLGGLVAREGATRVSLDVLPPGDAHSLIGRLLDDSRAAPAAAQALASACAYLPLALRIAVAHLLDRPHLTATELAARLRDGNRLRQLAISGDETMAVRKTFELSYRSIPEDAQLVFRRLGVVPCHDFTAESVAALAEQTQAVGEQLLDLLCDAHLVGRTADRRYVVHDLLREYASELCKTEDSAAAIDAAANRLQESFLARLCAATRVLYPITVHLPEPHWAKDVNTFGNKDLALAWLDAEHRNIVAVIQAATSIGSRSNAWLLADQLRGYLDMRRHLAHWLGAARAGLLAARAAKDELAMASMFHMLAHAYGSVGKYEPALKNLERAVALSRSCGWKEGLAMALGNVGVVQGLIGKPEAAEPMFIQSLELWREIGRIESEAKTYTIWQQLAGKRGS